MAQNSVAFKITLDNTDKILAEKEELIRRAMVEVGLDMERFAKEGCPVDTGRLRNSITFATVNFHSPGNDNPGASASSEDMAMRGTPNEAEVYVGTNVEYAPYVENGSSKRGAGVHMLKNSIQGHENDYKEIIKNILDGG